MYDVFFFLSIPFKGNIIINKINKGYQIVEEQRTCPHAGWMTSPQKLRIKGRRTGRRAVCMGWYSLHSGPGVLPPVYRRDDPPHRFLFRWEGRWNVAKDPSKKTGGSLRSVAFTDSIEGAIDGRSQWEFRNLLGGYEVDPNITVETQMFEPKRIFRLKHLSLDRDRDPWKRSTLPVDTATRQVCLTTAKCVSLRVHRVVSCTFSPRSHLSLSLSRSLSLSLSLSLSRSRVPRPAGASTLIQPLATQRGVIRCAQRDGSPPRQRQLQPAWSFTVDLLKSQAP